MARNSLVWGLLVFGCGIQALSAASEDDPLEYMSKEEREALKEEARDMFYHAYHAYMDNAYPADELMPLSCKGRYRGSEPNRGDIDSTLGNFSLTLVDTLDTLVVLGDLEEFENAVKLVARDVSFDTDVIVSLFETNIRMLGGLLSGHILAEYLQQRADIMPWYRGELLNLAKDLGYRFLPAFNTTTGIPYGRINLKHGMKGVPMEVSRETCTACAGSMILEMAALSRLTGESIFEEKAQKAMDVLWRMRHRGTDLMGSVLNVNSGDWVRRDSGVGAGIDSYYEYCLKAYILLGDEKYLGRFNRHYEAVMKYVSQGPMLLDVHMHRPNTNSKNFMDALLAFWPGLQVLKGDIKPAVETHEMLYQVMQRHNFIPEAFTTDFQVHWGHHPLRPEFLESTYFLYRATGDHYYLTVGRKVLKSLQTYARVPCGYAAVSDVRTNKHDDTMDSFVLSETFKYLFLLFAEPDELVLDLDEFIFTTEGHLLPLTLASIRTNISSEFERDIVYVDEVDRTCPNSLHLFPASVRQPLRNMVEDVCPRRTIKRRLSAAQFQVHNLEHLKMLSDMGITTLTLADGRVRLLHTFSNAKTPQDSEEGQLFMQEMVEISKIQPQQAAGTKPQAVAFVKPNSHPPEKVTLVAGPARFGPELQGPNKVSGKIVFTCPFSACTELTNADKLAGKIAVMGRGDCMFVEKARMIQKAGAVAGIVLDNEDGSSAARSPMFTMLGDEKEVDDVTIPVVFLFSIEANVLRKAVTAADYDLTVTIGNFFWKEDVQLKAPTDLSMFERIKGSLKSFLTRHVTPQTSASTGTNLDVTIPESKQQEDKEEKDTVVFGNLRAEIIGDVLGGEVRITATSGSPAQTEDSKETRETKESKETETPTTAEQELRQFLTVFVNQIYADSKTGLTIRTFILENYCDWIASVREKKFEKPDVTLGDKVLWFLMELSQIPANPSITKMGQLTYANRQKLVLQYLLAKMDNMVLNMKSVTKKLSRMKLEDGPNMLLMTVELRSIQKDSYMFLNVQLTMLLNESGIVSPSEKESIGRHFELLNQVNKATNEEFIKIIDNELQGIWGKSEMSRALVHNWQRHLVIHKHLEVLRKTKIDNAAIADVLTDTNESSKPKVSSKEVFKTPKKNEDVKSVKLEDFEHFVLTEIQKAVKNSEENVFWNYQENSGIPRDTSDNKSKDTGDSGKVIINVNPQNQSWSEKVEDRIKYKMELMKNKIKDFAKHIEFLADLTKDVYSLANMQANDVEFQESVVRDKQSDKEISEDPSQNANNFPLPDTQVTINTANVKAVESTTQDEKTEIATEDSEQTDGKHNKISLDQLAEFIRAIWAATELMEKDFEEVKRESEIPEVEYCTAEGTESWEKRKYYGPTENKIEDTEKHEGKHIDDDELL